MSKIDTLDPAFHVVVDAVRLEAYQQTGYEWVVVSATREIKEQHGLFMQSHDGIDNDGDGKIDEADEKVTNADGGQSPHNFKLACDCGPKLSNGEIWWAAPKSLWKTYADIAVKHGLVAGFYFKSIYDAPHIETKDWRDVKAKWKQGLIHVS